MKNDAGAVPEAVQILTRAIVDICHFVGGCWGQQKLVGFNQRLSQ